ncbi:LysM peptidoglycan-binding domain-containing protein [Photobacterium leiognathi]|uniref:LysM peptidoglycan-binding domain-containing protein n=1 Tax=Photobacterium leiognathi TaxID=553611 RepID=UPI002981A0B7|nr:LysM domain-containing protein [Photobacterium leiognathi]
MTTHKITKDECLSLIAKRYGTTVAALKQLNPDQIINIDLIYEGNTLNLPASESISEEKSETSTVKRKTLPEMPSQLAQGNTTCSAAKIEYTDILYVPSHPKTGNRAWYAVTEEAKKAITSERNTLNEIAKKTDKSEKLAYLNELGILSKMQTKTHYQFLNPEQVDEYQALIYQMTVLKSGADKLDKKNRFVLSVAKQHGMKFDESLTWSYAIEQIKDTGKTVALSAFSSSPTEYILQKYSQVEHQSEIKEKAVRKVRNKLIALLQEKIDRLQREAELKAKNGNADDGTHFVYDKNSQFFTSKKQVDIAKSVKIIRQCRPVQEDKLICFSKEELNEYYDKTFPESLESNSNTNVHALILNDFKRELIKLNNWGYVIKEQCLSREQLIGGDNIPDGPQELKNVDWRKSAFMTGELSSLNLKTDLIKNIYEELCGGQQINIDDLVQEARFAWPYYPTKALISVVDITLKEIKKVFESLLGSNEMELPVLKQLLWIKKVALARKAHLERIAIENAKHNRHIAFVSQFIKEQAFTVILDEAKFKVTEKKVEAFVNKAGANDIQIVECCFMSDGVFFWIRGPHWYMPEDEKNKSSLNHVKIVNATLSVVDIKSDSTSVGQTFEEGITALRKPEVKVIDLSSKIESLTNAGSAIWNDSYHYQSGISPNGQSSAYEMGAEAQLMRFISAGETKIMLPTGDSKGLELSNTLGANVEIKGKLNVLSARLHFSSWLPLHENNNGKNTIKDRPVGLKVNIPYRKSNEGSNDTIETYSIGALCMKISGQIYGVAGVSMQLSSGIALGPSDTGGGIGIRGSSINIPEYNLNSNQQANGVIVGGAPYLAGVAAEAKISVDVFAGVEAGGDFSGEVYWKPQDAIFATDSRRVTNTYELLGKLTTQASVNYGIGANSEFRLTYQDGCFIVIAAARFVVGAGCSGKVAIELNANNVDRFISCCLSVLNQSGFKQIALFGECDENGVNEDFVIFNDYLTLSIALGLSFGEVLLLPATSIAYYQKETLKAKYAPVLAKQILRKENRDLMQKWITQLPPETLAKLFSCLIKSQMKKDESQLQVAAILQILDWIKPNPKDDTHCKQFEKALILMNGDMESQQSPLTQWSSFKMNWGKLAEFIKNNDDSLKTQSALFNNLSSLLCKNMTLYKVEKNIMIGSLTEYLCFYNKDISNAEIREIRDNLQSTLVDRGLKPMAWSIEL